MKSTALRPIFHFTCRFAIKITALRENKPERIIESVLCFTYNVTDEKLILPVYMLEALSYKWQLHYSDVCGHPDTFW